MPVNSSELHSSGEPSPAPYSVGYSALLLVNSFRFAQGDSIRQPTILKYLALNFRSQLSPEVLRAAVDPATQAAATVLLNRLQHDEIYTRGETKEQIVDGQRNTMQGYAEDLIGFIERDPEELRAEFQMEELVRIVIENDALHLGLGEDSRHDARAEEPRWYTEHVH